MSNSKIKQNVQRPQGSVRHLLLNWYHCSGTPAVGIKSLESVNLPWHSDSISKNETRGNSNQLIHSSIDRDSKTVEIHGGLSNLKYLHM